MHEMSPRHGRLLLVPECRYSHNGISISLDDRSGAASKLVLIQLHVVQARWFRWYSQVVKHFIAALQVVQVGIAKGST
jgi:hypothetical protein